MGGGILVVRAGTAGVGLSTPPVVSVSSTAVVSTELFAVLSGLSALGILVAGEGEERGGEVLLLLAGGGLLGGGSGGGLLLLLLSLGEGSGAVLVTGEGDEASEVGLDGAGLEGLDHGLLAALLQVLIESTDLLLLGGSVLGGLTFLGGFSLLGGFALDGDLLFLGLVSLLLFLSVLLLEGLYSFLGVDLLTPVSTATASTALLVLARKM